MSNGTPGTVGGVPIYEVAMVEVEKQFDLARDYVTQARNLAEGLLNNLATISGQIKQIDTNVALEGADYSITPFTETTPTKPDTSMNIGSPPVIQTFSLDLPVPDSAMNIGSPPVRQAISLDLSVPDSTMNFGSPPVRQTFSLDLPAPDITFNIGLPPDKGNLKTIDLSGLAIPDISGLVVQTDPINPAAVTYESPLLTALKARLLADVQTDIDRPSVETAKWNRARARDLLLHQDMLAQKRAEWSKSGLPLPDGALSAAVESEDIRYANAYDDRSGQIAIEESNLAIQVRQSAIAQATQLESILMNFLQTTQQRLFEASRATVEAKIQVYNIEIGKYRIMTDIYQVVSNVKIAEAKNSVDIYTAEVGAYRVGVDAEIARVDAPIKVYQAVSNVKIAEARTLVDSYVAEVTAFRVGVEAESARIDALVKTFNAEVDAYRANIQAYQALSSVAIEILKTQTNLAISRAGLYQKNAEIQINEYEALTGLRIEVVKAMGAIVAQEVAGALSSIHAAASMSRSDSASATETISST